MEVPPVERFSPAGVRQVAHLDDYPAMMRLQIPAVLWDDLRAEGLIPPEAPTPA